jgi:type IV secretory pathway VirB2 component (pilin)
MKPFSFFSSHSFKRVSAVLILLFIVTGFAAAQTGDDPLGLSKHVGTLLSIFTSPAIKGIACVFLIILCIGLITQGRQEPELFKKFVPWIAGTVLFMAASTITKKFVNTDSLAEQYQQDLGVSFTN